jgi:transposase
MCYELTESEWAAIRPMLPNNPRGVPRVNDRRVLKWHLLGLATGALWRDLPREFGHYTPCHNRFVRWRRSRIPGALAAACDAAVQMIGTSIARLRTAIAAVELN